MSKSINPFRASLCLDSSYVVLELEVKKTNDLNTTMFCSNEYVEVNDDEDNNDDDDTMMMLMMIMMVILIVSLTM